MFAANTVAGMGRFIGCRSVLMAGVALTALLGRTASAAECGISITDTTTSAGCEISGNNTYSIGSGGSVTNLSNMNNAVIVTSSATSADLINNGAITGAQSGIWSYNGTISNLTNGSSTNTQATISASESTYSAFGILGNPNGYFGVLTNYGTIQGASTKDTADYGGYGIFLSGGNIGTLNNYGSIIGTDSVSGVGSGILSYSATIGTLANETGATINGTQYGIQNNSGTITTLNNYGTISGGTYDIFNSGIISTLTNAQSGLTYYKTSGSLNNYVVYVTNSSNYGSLIVLSSGGLSLSSLGIAGNYTSGRTYSDVIKLSSGGTLTLGGTTISSGSYDYTYNGISYSVTLDTSSCSVGYTCYNLTAGSGSSSGWTAKGISAGGGATNLGAALDVISNNSGLSSQLTALSALSSSGQAFALRQLAANTISTSVGSTGATVTPSNTAIDTHLSATVADASGNKGAAAGNAFQQGSVWGQVLGNHSSLDNSSAGDGFSSNAFGFLVGADTFASDNAVAGFAFNWLRNNAKGKGDSSGNSTTTDTYQLSLYGSWRPGGDPLWLQGLVAAGINQYDQKRDIDYLNETASAKYYGLQAQVKTTVGYDFPLEGGFTASPLGSLQVSRMQNRGYTETGSTVNQSIAAQGFNSAESVIGGRLVRTFGTNFGDLTADIQAGWLHDYLHSPITTVATLAGTGYVINTARLPSNGAQLSLGATVQQSDDISIRL